MKTITVTGFKGGVAKSTNSLHLATYFSDKGKTVLLDGDPNRTAISVAVFGFVGFLGAMISIFRRESVRVKLVLNQKGQHSQFFLYR